MGMHIAFLTLFLGLTTGAQPFEISVAGQPAAVEILLDGVVAQRLSRPPWEGKIDFGADLAPHELVARAVDTDGREVARTRQWINLPRPPAEVEIALEEKRPGAPGRVRLTWERLTHDPPLSGSLTLDGKPLELDGSGRAALPSYNPETVHVLTAELRFPLNIMARKDLIFGGEGGETYTELTAVPVRLLGMRGLPDLAVLQDWFVDGSGRPLKVAAVENGPGELYLVRVPGTDYIKNQIGLRPPGRMPLGGEDRIRSVSPWGRVYGGQWSRSELFDFSPYFKGPDGLAIHLAKGYFKLDGSERLRPADSVAVAGLQAMAGGRRRIVVLLLDAKSGDDSRYDPATVRRYLSSIRVPLYVWSIDRDIGSMKAWGTVESAWDAPNLERAFRKAAVDLEHQRIVLIEGRYLPQSIRLSPKAAGIEIVAAKAGER
jgi:hypothetical protein